MINSKNIRCYFFFLNLNFKCNLSSFSFIFISFDYEKITHKQKKKMNTDSNILETDRKSKIQKDKTEKEKRC